MSSKLLLQVGEANTGFFVSCVCKLFILKMCSDTQPPGKVYYDSRNVETGNTHKTTQKLEILPLWFDLIIFSRKLKQRWVSEDIIVTLP